MRSHIHQLPNKQGVLKLGNNYIGALMCILRSTQMTALTKKYQGQVYNELPAKKNILYKDR